MSGFIKTRQGKIDDLLFESVEEVRSEVIVPPSLCFVKGLGKFTAEYSSEVDNGTSVIDTATSGIKLIQFVEQPSFGPEGTLGGFMDYNDASTSTTPVTLVADTWTTIPNDGLGAFTNKTYKPDGNVIELMNSSGQIDPTGLTLGDVIFIRNDFKVNPNTNNASLKFRYVLGTGAGEYTLENSLGRLDEGSGKDYRFSLKVDKIYMGDTNTRDNLITLQVNCSSNGTLVNAGTSVSVLRYI